VEREHFAALIEQLQQAIVDKVGRRGETGMDIPAELADQNLLPARPGL
jgi:hypothetical protein